MIYVMSGGAKAFAVIGAAYPAGSVCTCTNGSKTLNLKDTGGQGFFLIPYAGTWTVTCTDGVNTKAKSVEITSEGQNVSVELSYELVIFDYSNFAGNVKDIMIADGYGNIQLTGDNEIKVSDAAGMGANAKTKDSFEKGNYSAFKITCKGGTGFLRTLSGSEISKIVMSSTEYDTYVFDLSGVDTEFRYHTITGTTIRRMWLE